MPGAPSPGQPQRTVQHFVRDDQICVLTFDRPGSAANIFDRRTLTELGEELDFIAGAPQLNGVILLSSILNYGRRDPGFDQELINYIPSYAATAVYHHRSASQPANNRSALYHSALISTALPRRGVTTQSPTLASIQVS